MAMLDFNGCLDFCGLVDLHSQGHKMTWCNGQQGQSWKWTRLDKAMVNIAFANIFQSSYVEVALWKFSSHSPLVIFFDV